MTDHEVGSREEWLAAREGLLRREKEHTRLGDELARQRRELPWVRVEKEYRFATDEGTRPLAEAGMPPVITHLASASGTDPAGYLSEAPGLSAFVLDAGTVYHTYSTTARGLEFLMGYYPILDRAPKGRDESDASQFWIRRHDEY